MDHDRCSFVELSVARVALFLLMESLDPTGRKDPTGPTTGKSKPEGWKADEGAATDCGPGTAGWRGCPGDAGAGTGLVLSEAGS